MLGHTERAVESRVDGLQGQQGNAVRECYSGCRRLDTHLSAQGLCSLQVLLSICSLLTDPNPDDPLVPEIAHM